MREFLKKLFSKRSQKNYDLNLCQENMEKEKDIYILQSMFPSKEVEREIFEFLALDETEQKRIVIQQFEQMQKNTNDLNFKDFLEMKIEELKKGIKA